MASQPEWSTSPGTNDSGRALAVDGTNSGFPALRRGPASDFSEDNAAQFKFNIQ